MMIICVVYDDDFRTISIKEVNDQHKHTKFQHVMLQLFQHVMKILDILPINKNACT